MQQVLFGGPYKDGKNNVDFMAWNISKLSMGAMKGFGLGLVMSVLVAVATTSVITTTSLLVSPFVIVFTLLGLGLAFEDATN